jgi:hypothetical protein
VQFTEQPPQLLESVWMFASHPSAGLPLQSVKPGLHRNPHTEPVHVGDEFGRKGHAEPQALQLFGLVARFVHAPAQLVSPPGHATSQRPAAHTWPVGQAMAQPPQLRASLRVSASHPSAVVPLQLANPTSQLIRQVPVVHVADAFDAGVHTVPQVPQLSGLAAVLASQPVPTSPSQSANPGEHARLHMRAAHAATPLMPPEHCREHTPQLRKSVPMLVSQPFGAASSQSA